MAYGFKRLKTEEKLILWLLNKENGPINKLLMSRQMPDFDLFIQLVLEHRIAPPILSRLLDQFSDKLPKELCSTFRLHLLRERANNILQKKELISVSQLLSQAGIDVTVMKGMSYDPSGKIERMYGDIDLLVAEKEVLGIIQLLQQNGYSYKGSFILSREEKKDIESQLSWNNQYQFACPNSHGGIEIHTNLFERDRIRLENLTGLLDRPELYKKKRQWNDELSCYIPRVEASLLLLCLQCALKRALYNNRFILRHITDMDILFDRGVDSKDFVELCKITKTSYYAAFSIHLYCVIRKQTLPNWFPFLERNLKSGEFFLLKLHLKCLNNLRSSHGIYRFLYNFIAPFIIGGTTKQRLTWLRNNVFPTKVQQENRYYRFGIKKDSFLIYFTYFINPIQDLWRSIKKHFKFKDNS